MHPDRKIGFAMGILLVGIVAALFFRNEPLTMDDLPTVRREKQLNDQLRARDVAVYLKDAEPRLDPRNLPDDSPPWTMRDLVEDLNSRNDGVPLPVGVSDSNRGAAEQPGRGGSHEDLVGLPLDDFHAAGRYPDAAGRNSDTDGRNADGRNADGRGRENRTPVSERMGEDIRVAMGPGAAPLATGKAGGGTSGGGGSAASRRPLPPLTPPSNKEDSGSETAVTSDDSDSPDDRLNPPSKSGTLFPNQQPKAVDGLKIPKHFDEYTVKYGDTLSHIAERFLGSQSRFHEIFDANRDRISAPDKLQVGKSLRIPRK